MQLVGSITLLLLMLLVHLLDDNSGEVYTHNAGVTRLQQKVT